MARPISPGGNNLIDATYRYGSTQEGARPTHHGVEFPNEEGTLVLAAAHGVVIVAGDDYQEAYADFPFYYGNLVILEHQFPGIETQVFSLYGHLSNVLVQVGDQVEVGDQIGTVGYTGVAEWSHLHFEVRVGENLYAKTRNPELWLMPHQNEQGEFKGALAGRIVDEFGTPIYIPNVVVERLSDVGEVVEIMYVETYADFTVNGDDEWGENFAISDLLPGRYRVSFVARGLQVWELEVHPGQLTLMVFDASEL
jgi:murein DD-endopeptidase MepM/ murein hydrolase activator NlpD